MQLRKQIHNLLLAVLTTAGLQAGSAFAHGVSEVMDVQGDDAAFTALARVTCFNDGNGEAAYLMSRIRDKSPAIPGLLVTVHILKGGRAINATDTSPGDADYSVWAALPGGNGVYQLMLTKTAAGARAFDLEWHCMTADNVHTGTDILVDQYD